MFRSVKRMRSLRGESQAQSLSLALAYKGFVTINWDEMEKQGKALMDFNKDGSMDKSDFKYVLNNLTKIAGTVQPPKPSAVAN
eukprot:6047395-Pyramimonas_sp.AAC.1